MKIKKYRLNKFNEPLIKRIIEEAIYMNQDKMHLVNKIFNNETIRTIWDENQEKYFISIVDLVGILSESDRPRKYWSDLKSKLKQEGNEVSEKIGQLKLKSQDGKYRLTDVCDIEEMFRIIESIPSKNAEVFCTKWHRYFNAI